MSNLSKEQAYIDIIERLYGSSIYVDEHMINEAVEDMVITLLDEIRKCTLRAAPITTTVNALADVLHDTWKKFGIKNPKKFLQDFFRGNKKIFKNQLKAMKKGFLKEFIKQWFDILFKNRNARICVMATARNYKSPLALALIGL